MNASGINPELMILIEASKLGGPSDKFMQHEPRTWMEEHLKSSLQKVIKMGISDFYRPKFDPSLSEDGTICFKSGNTPAIGKSYVWWEEKAPKVDTQRGSRLGTVAEYTAFLGFLIKKLVESGWSVDDAWDAVCNDSSKLGHYWTSLDTKHFLESTGSREVCGFYDLANTYKVLAIDKEPIGFWMAGGGYGDCGDACPLASMGLRHGRLANLYIAVGWIIFEK